MTEQLIGAPRFRGRVRRPQVLVIGGGLAGMAAALAARRTGARVTLVAEGAGVLELASGCIDRLSVPFDALPPEHPYRLLGMDAVDRELAAFREELARVGWPLSDDSTGRPLPASGGAVEVITALGARRLTYLTAPGMAAPPPDEPVWVVGFRGLRDFDPAVVAAGLGNATWSWVDLPGAPEEIHPVALARQLEDERYRSRVIARVRAALAGSQAQEQWALFPAVLGLAGAVGVQQAVAEATGMYVAEVLLPPPSVPGLRLAEFLRRAIQQAGVDLALGSRAVRSQVKDGRVVAVVCEGPGGRVRYEAEAYVLATGGLLGNGLVADGLEVKEPVFGLPVATPQSADPSAWADARFLPEGGHSFVRIGVSVNEELRPAGYSNLFVCGRTLAGYDPYAEGCGGGVAVATGGVAGRRAGRLALTDGGERQ